ncbi:hypothetical protein SLA2020_527620 [Shorea laevis]
MSLTQPVPPPSFGSTRVIFLSWLLAMVSFVSAIRINNVVIWNPATKETKVVPKSNMPHFPAGHDTIIHRIGFGFDAKTNDYKIINLISLVN